MKMSKINQKINEMVEKIVKDFNPYKIILFGSQAKGNANKDSDVDLLVVLPFSGRKRDKVIEIRVALSDIRISKDIFVATPDDLETYKDLMGTIIYIALKDGKIVYEQAA
jgi:uncharacterized protein